MGMFMKINVTKRMLADYEECARMMDEYGKDKSCDGCSCNGGDELGCLGEQRWQKDES